MKKKSERKRRTARLTALLLAVVMTVSTQGITSLAATVSEDVESAGGGSSVTIVNPVHTCNESDGTKDTTTWSYVYFGSYPQSEVTDEATTSAIDAKIAEISESGNEYPGKKADVGTDVWVDGIKYRRISKTDTNYNGYFGESAYRYFKWERIKWRVLKKDGTDLFLLADTALDCATYHDKYDIVTWEESALRNWLNNSFYETAFNTSEQNSIVEQSVENEDNPQYNTEGGAVTTDKIYSLSISEIMNSDYGFCPNDSTTSASRRMQPSSYACARGTFTDTGSDCEGNCWWWLRSPGKEKYAGFVTTGGSINKTGQYVTYTLVGVVPALHINMSDTTWYDGSDSTSGDGGEDRILTSMEASKTKITYTQGETLNLDDLTVNADYLIRGKQTSLTVQKEAYTTNVTEIDMNTPGEKTLTVSCTENNVTKTADILITVIPEGTPGNPVHDCHSFDIENDTTTWSYIYFGSYPQSEVTDEATISAIDAKIAEISASGNEYPGKDADTGTDVWVNGIKYRRITKSDTNSDKNFGDNSYRYFQWERLKWRVLWNDGTELFLLADTPLDCKNYHDGTEDITWESSSLREWLNGSFYETAFNIKEQNAILEQTVLNENNPVYDTEGGNDTKDKVFLLSIGEATNLKYGFCKYYHPGSASRQMYPSSYAIARGTWIDKGRKGESWWWFRSVGKSSDKAIYANTDGYINESGASIGITDDLSVVPALHINLSSDMWIKESDCTSGAGGEEEVLTSLKATKKKTTYTQGEALHLDDLTVEAEYLIQKSITLQQEAYTTNAAAIDMNTPGDKTLTVSYTEKGVTKTAAIVLTVNKKPEEKPGDNPGENPSDNPGGNPSTNPGGNAGGDSQDNQNQPVKVTKLTIEAPSKKLAAGKKVKLAVTAAPADATNQTVTWTTSNKKYATIDQNGKLNLKKAGAGKTVTITATAQDGSGVKATIKITIMKDAVKSLKLKAPSKTLKAGKTMTIKTTIKTTGKKVNKTLKWTTSDKSYATVNNKGKVTAKKAGKGKTVTITAQTTDGSGKKAKVKVKIQ